MRRYKWGSYVAIGLAILFFYFAVGLGQQVAKEYWYLVIPAFFFTLLAFFLFKKYSHLKLVDELRIQWGKNKQKKRDFAKIRLYFDLSKVEDGFRLDDRTWQDLNMDEVYARVDRTLTYPGSQKLYVMLRNLLFSQKKLQERNRLISLFQEQKEIREQVQIALGKFGNDFGWAIPSLLWEDKALKKPKYAWFFSALFLAMIIGVLLLAFVSPKGIIAFLSIGFSINMYLHFREQKRNQYHFETIKALSRLVYIGKLLTKKRIHGLEAEQKKLKKIIHSVGKYSRIVFLVGLESGDPYLGVLWQYVSILFLSEVRAFYKALGFIEKNRETLQELYLVISELDALQAVASYREGLEFYSLPVFANDESEKSMILKANDFYHPLLKEPVCNSLTIKNHGILITGSNMSGKSTFLRTMGVNAVFAQTIFTCHAREYCSPFLQVITSIGRSDNIIEGQSYYLVEALSVLRTIEKLNPNRLSLCIYDELFRGTNSSERLTANVNVLRYVSRRNAIVLVATHDLELTEILADCYINYHFSEKVGSQGLEFDYRLKDGPSTTSNALALLEYLGYPPEIVKKATS
ncbi:MAG: hypothetical protein GX020_07250 [Firmicutes bacterium]|nr:hypothetical protein [Bacillota bacterium]